MLGMKQFMDSSFFYSTFDSSYFKKLLQSYKMKHLSSQKSRYNWNKHLQTAIQSHQEVDQSMGRKIQYSKYLLSVHE